MTIDCCLRCSQRHENLPEEELIGNRSYWTHWSMCPVLGQPILTSDRRDEWEDMWTLVSNLITAIHEEEDERDLVQEIVDRMKK